MLSKIIRAAIMLSIGAATVATADGKSTEYECDQGGAEAGYRFRVVDLGRDASQILVLRKSHGNATVAGDAKVRRVGGGAEFTGRGITFRRGPSDSDGSFNGTFTIKGRHGPVTVKATCGKVETITL